MNELKEVEITNLLDVDYVYLPYDKNMNLHVKDKEYIYKNQLILDSETKKVNSSVSGNILGLTTINDKKYIVVENDFKEKQEKKVGCKRYINNYTKEEFCDLINDYRILNDFDPNSKVLVVSGIDEYIGEITYTTLLKKYTIEILDTIDAIIEIMNIKKAFLAINNSDADCVNVLYNNMGTYPKIDLKLFSYDYSIGNKHILINKLTSYKNKNYGVLYLNIKDVLNLYNLLKRRRPLSETYITLTGDLIDYTKVLRVKIGTNLSDIINKYKIDKKDNIIFNGLLNGIKINSTNFVIDNNVRSIFINSLNSYKETKCINCGMCINSCPQGINPKYMHFNKDKKANLYRSKCVNCGLCSYVCPSKINLRENEVYNDKK